MKPRATSQTALGITQSKAKMYEYGVPDKFHIKIPMDPSKLFTLSIGILGDLAAQINEGKPNDERTIELQNEIRFSSQFFDSYVESKIGLFSDEYTTLLGAASYYLSNLPGSAKVLADKCNGIHPNEEAGSLDQALLWILKGDYSTSIQIADRKYKRILLGIESSLSEYWRQGSNVSRIEKLSINLRRKVYLSGTPRELLLGDVISAVLKKKIENSSWRSIPEYSGITPELWNPIIAKSRFIKELWPAQHLIGRMNVLRGESAVLQMPTSAGKTKATELIIRSAFLSGRANLAIIVAPFKSLCHEIHNSLGKAFIDEDIIVDELTDAIQDDYELELIRDQHKVLIVTPEKLLYTIRQLPDFSKNVGLLIFDEGHQFDAGTRGITYELLITSLLEKIKCSPQKVLISAVIKNAEAVGEWLNGDDPIVVTGKDLNPTLRSIGFVSWKDTRGRIEFPSGSNLSLYGYYVPRVIQSAILSNSARETKVRSFPERGDGKSISVYLGVKLNINGAVAIFCGRKDTAESISRYAVDSLRRGIDFPHPSTHCNSLEVERLRNLNARHFGAKSIQAISAEYGIFSHHRNVPHGVRLCVEHAMRTGDISFVICTSTLAQGVNLPIKYLLVTSIYNGKEKISVRDFHNLIGRVGRAGMHTEGSVLFADSSVFDEKNSEEEKWKWNLTLNMLDPQNSEDCVSSLLKYIPLIIQNTPNLSYDRRPHSLSVPIIPLAKALISNEDLIPMLTSRLLDQQSGKGFTAEAIEPKLRNFKHVLSSIESFIMSHLSDEENHSMLGLEAGKLAEQTLAYHMGNIEQKEQIRDLFILLANTIISTTPDKQQQRIYGKTLLGLRQILDISDWLGSNIESLAFSNSDEEVFEAIWPMLKKHVSHKAILNCDNLDHLLTTGTKWISGHPFDEILADLHQNNVRFFWGKKRKEITAGDVVDICENGFGYDFSLLIGALCNLIDDNYEIHRDKLGRHLKSLQKRLKYGVPTPSAIMAYEIGFSDRVLAQDISDAVRSRNRTSFISKLQSKSREIRDILSAYPSYFTDEILNKLQI